MTDPPASLAAALAALQADLPHVVRRTEGQAGPRKYKYADLPDVTAALMPRLSALGLTFTCCPTLILLGNDPKFVLEYRLEHGPTGEHRGGLYPLGTGTPQQLGSAISYARRYCLCSVVGLAPDEDDDDAAAAEQEARAMSRRPPETRADGSATEAELVRIAHDQAGWTREHPAAPGRTEWDADPAEKGDPRTSAMRGLHHLYGELGIKHGQDMRDDIAGILREPCESLADLSLEQILSINGALRRRRDAQRKAESVTNR